MKYEQKVQVETQEYICLVKRIDGVVAQKNLVSELIRCKDCKFYRQEIDMCDEPYSTAHNVVHEDDFCSKAERKEHE